MDKLKLRVMVLEFLTLAVESIKIQEGEGDEAKFLNTSEVLAMWMDLPDCNLSPMFIGYALAKGVDINSFTPEDLAHAVETAMLGEDDGVDFDWIGDCDATHKPH